jgi:hypothetical protein
VHLGSFSILRVFYGQFFVFGLRILSIVVEIFHSCGKLRILEQFEGSFLNFSLVASNSHNWFVSRGWNGCGVEVTIPFIEILRF